MTTTLQISMIVAELIYFGLVLFFLKKKMLSLKYSLLWLVAGAAMLFFTVFPMMMIRLVKLFGVESAMNGLFSLLIFFILTIIMSLTAIVSGQAEKIRTLTQSQALLEERIRELEEKKPEGEKQ